MLTERETRALMIDCAERVVLDALEVEDLATTNMVRVWNFSDDRGLALVGSLVGAFTRMREEGVRAVDLQLTPLEAAREQLARQLARCLELCADARRSRDRDVADIGGQCENLLQRFELATGTQIIDAVSAVIGQKRKEPIGELKRAVLGHKDSLADADLDPVTGFGLCHHLATVMSVPIERAARTLLATLEERYDQALTARGALDFNAMLVKTRDLLRDDLHARQEEQARFGALLVDEFQDTNRLQLELVHLLAEKRHGRPRPTTPPLPFAEGIEVAELPLEPGFVCIVGDRKQSIYEFRGSDVSVFEQAANAIEESGGGRAYLLTSRRASPKLVDFFNAAFPPLMPAGAGARLAPRRRRPRRWPRHAAGARRAPPVRGRLQPVSRPARRASNAADRRASGRAARIHREIERRRRRAADRRPRRLCPGARADRRRKTAGG